MSRPKLCLVALAVVLGSCLGAAGASANQSSVVAGDGGSAHVVNGVTTGSYPAVGALLLGDAENGRSWCSGTLIGCQTLITAAHCVCATNGDTCTRFERPNPSLYTVFFQQGGFVGVDAIDVHPDYQFPHADIAVLHLSRPVTDVRPLPINTEASPAVATVGTIVGFGSSGGGKADFGIMRSGRVSVAEGMVDRGDGLLGWHFRGDLGEPGSNSNTCGGDSGGPLLLEAQGAWMLAGTTSGGQNGSCMTDDVSIDTDVFMYRDWISAVAGGDLSTPCGRERDEASIQRLSLDDALDDDRPSALHVVEVPRAATFLRVTMNGVDDGRTDFDLEVRGPNGAARCTQDGRSQFAVCEIVQPRAGTWEIRVDRIVGSGAYQLNAATTAAPMCSPTPRAECARSAVSHHALLSRPGRDGGQAAFTWRWTQTQRGADIEYGDPTVETDYAFCVYDDEDRLLLNAALQSGARWNRYRRGFMYQGDGGRGANISHARLRSATRSRTAIMVKGRGINPIARVSLANHNTQVRTQLQGNVGCWETSQMLAQKR